MLDVFKQRASEDYKKDGHCKEIFKKTFWVLFLMALPPSLILYFWVDDLFSFVFGEPWREAGVYAQILIPALFLRFIANPLSFMIYIAEKQVWNFLCMAGLLPMILAGLLMSNDAVEAVRIISISYCLYYLLHLMLSFKLAVTK